MATEIIDVQARERALALPAPIRIGPMLVTERRYTVVSIACADGTVGQAFAQSRGAPIAEIVLGLFAQTLRGADGDAIAERHDELLRATVAVGRVGLVLRALSLVDLALWDARGKRLGAPVHALLGTARDRVALTRVAGSPRRAEDLESVVAAARLAVADGAATVKVSRTPDPALTRELLDRLSATVPDAVAIVIDANWCWRSVEDAAAELRSWPLERLAWVEDPFVPEDVEALAMLRRRLPVRVAAGDELADPWLARRLLDEEVVDVLRLDVATIGGITTIEPLLRHAAERGVPVSLHISPETSLQVALAHPIVRDVESFDRRGNAFDPSHELIAAGPSLAGGWAEPAAAPGLGFSLIG